MNQIKIKKLREGFYMPEIATPGSAAYDALLPADHPIKYGRQVIPLGFALEMPTHMACNGRSRSGYTAKGLLVRNRFGNESRIDADVQLGLIDSDYRGEIAALIICRSWKVRLFGWFMGYHVCKKQAISQLAFYNVPETTLTITDELSKTIRGKKGMGAANGE